MENDAFTAGHYESMPPRALTESQRPDKRARHETASVRPCNQHKQHFIQSSETSVDVLLNSAVTGKNRFLRKQRSCFALRIRMCEF